MIFSKFFQKYFFKFSNLFFSMKNFCLRKIIVHYIDIQFSGESIFRILGAIWQVFRNSIARKKNIINFVGKIGGSGVTLDLTTIYIFYFPQPSLKKFIYIFFVQSTKVYIFFDFYMKKNMISKGKIIKTTRNN